MIIWGKERKVKQFEGCCETGMTKMRCKKTAIKMDSGLFGAGGRTSRPRGCPLDGWPGNTRLRAGIFSSVHKRKTEPPQRDGSVIWCRWPDSNRHAVASGGF